MKTLNQSVETAGARAEFPAAIPWEAMRRTALSATWRLISSRWLIELLVIALMGLAIGVCALVGLAMLSTSVPALGPVTADHVAESGPDGVFRGDAWSRETE